MSAERGVRWLYKDMEWKLPVSPYMEIIRWEMPR